MRERGKNTQTKYFLSLSEIDPLQANLELKMKGKQSLAYQIVVNSNLIEDENYPKMSQILLRSS